MDVNQDEVDANREKDAGRTIILNPGQEFRFEIDVSKKTVTLKLKSGTAEIFGSELTTDPEYILSGKKLAVYTWHGCELQLKGETLTEYVADETPMASCLNVHLALEQLRQEAYQRGDVGPKVMVVGPADVGKTSLCKILLNYAVKQGRKPIFVDIDPNEGSVSLPGTLTAAALSRPIDVEEEFAATSAMMGTSSLVYYYGFASFAEKPKLYETVLNRLAYTVKRKLEDPDVRASGFIMDTPSQFVDVAGYEMLTHAIDQFGVNAILIIGHERLYSELSRRFQSNPAVSIVKLAKSGGVVTRDRTHRRALQMHRIKEYFYGTHKNELNPYSSLVNFADASVRRVGEGALAPSSALPLGSEPMQSSTRTIPIDAGDILLHSILAVSNAALPETPLTSDEESQLVLHTNIMGFVYVSEVDETRKRMTILAPNPGKLPKRYLIMGGLKWLET
ncbi:Pre-mRNA cleavage complex II protein Clp1-domain-containing protein [Gaertneriomyces semiglobifer]|nr:Pre-mRNA cleavage complex II protein Clp1-domain-containing protein [Gaertneriomyces semiglobifer]